MSAHSFRRTDEGAKHFVRVGRSTIEARNGILRDLLVRKGGLESWDRRPCGAATERDLDLLALRDALHRMSVFSIDGHIEPYVFEDRPLSPFVPSLCVREPLTNILRPRNFAMLLFGRDVQRFVPGAFSLFSIYAGADRSDLHAERHELAGTLVDQAQRLKELLDVQSYTAFDKDDPTTPNAVKYPRRALYEAMGNALAHRDYELSDPTRITVFDDRIEILSPGPLPHGVNPSDFREGRAGPKWRNQALAWFFIRLQIAQAEGQGIPTILRAMREEGSPEPAFEPTEISVVCVLPAHPRHALLRDLRDVEQAIALGALNRARQRVLNLLERDPFNYRVLQLFAEVQRALGDVDPLFAFIKENEGRIIGMPATVLLQLSESLIALGSPSEQYRELSKKLLSAATRGRLEERELRRVGVALLRARDGESLLSLIDRQLHWHPEWQDSASIHQLRGDAILELAGRCRQMAKRRGIAPETRQRAWRQFHNYLVQAEQELDRALVRSADPELTRIIETNIAYLGSLRRDNQPKHVRGVPRSR
jgi:predicted HTH transcriptional regulator